VSTDRLVQFLNERLDEEEADARAAFARSLSGQRRGQPEFSGRWGQLVDDIVRLEDGMRVGPTFWPPAVPHVLRHDPARVLADVAAKRAIIAEHKLLGSVYSDGILWCQTCTPRTVGPCVTLRLLAGPFADHSDFRQEWLLNN